MPLCTGRKYYLTVGTKHSWESGEETNQDGHCKDQLVHPNSHTSFLVFTFKITTLIWFTIFIVHVHLCKIFV